MSMSKASDCTVVRSPTCQKARDQHGHRKLPTGRITGCKCPQSWYENSFLMPIQGTLFIRIFLFTYQIIKKVAPNISHE